MKHWDLTPKEWVFLHSSARVLHVQFLFRDTRVAAFQDLHGKYHEFKLLESGELREAAGVAELIGATAGPGTFPVLAGDRREAIAASRLWCIEGPDRNTRGTL